MIKHTTTGRWKLGILLSLITAFLWGVTPIAIKIVLKDMDAYTISLYRFFLSAVLIGTWIFRKHGIPSLTGLRGSTLWLTCFAIIGLSANYAFFMIGLKYIPPSTAAVVIQLAPMFLLLGSLFVFKEKFGIFQFIGFIILIVGLTLFFNMRIAFLRSGFSTYGFGIVFIVLAAISWAVYALAQKQLLSSLPSPKILLFIYCGCFLVFVPFSKPMAIMNLSAIQFILLVFTCINTFVAYGSFSESLNHLEASRVSTLLSIIPLITIGSMIIIEEIFPGLIEAEPLNFISVLGAGMVVFGSMISSLIRSDHS